MKIVLLVAAALVLASLAGAVTMDDLHLEAIRGRLADANELADRLDPLADTQESCQGIDFDDEESARDALQADARWLDDQARSAKGATGGFLGNAIGGTVAGIWIVPIDWPYLVAYDGMMVGLAAWNEHRSHALSALETSVRQAANRLDQIVSRKKAACAIGFPVAAGFNGARTSSSRARPTGHSAGPGLSGVGTTR